MNVLSDNDDDDDVKSNENLVIMVKLASVQGEPKR